MLVCELTCPSCGSGELEVTSAAEFDDGAESVSFFLCLCGSKWMVSTRVVRAAGAVPIDPDWMAEQLELVDMEVGV